MKANEMPERIYLFDYNDAMVTPLEGDTVYVRENSFIEKAKEAFCKASCNGHPPRSTCTSLGTCKEYDEFIKAMKL